MIINLSEHPEVQRIVRFANPKYRKHKAIVVAAPQVEIQNTYWDGGSRSSYFAVNMATGQCGAAAGYNPPQFGGPAQPPLVDIPEGVAIVKLGTFCGKPATATVYLNPANMAKLLPA